MRISNIVKIVVKLNSIKISITMSLKLRVPIIFLFHQVIDSDLFLFLSVVKYELIISTVCATVGTTTNLMTNFLSIPYPIAVKTNIINRTRVIKMRYKRRDTIDNVRPK